MIIPIRCMSCGNMIADKWRFYQNELKRLKGTPDGTDVERYYFDGKEVAETAEKKVMDVLKLRRPCCKKHFLTQIDLIEKI